MMIMMTMRNRMVIMVMDHNVGVRSLPADQSVDKSALVLTPRVCMGD